MVEVLRVDVKQKQKENKMNIDKKLTPDEIYKINVLKIDIEDLQTKLNSKKRELGDFYHELRLKHSSLKIGDDIYNLTTGECVGTVTEIYSDFGELTCAYRYLKAGSEVCHSNTSRQSSFDFGSKQDLIDHLEQKVKALKSN